MASYATRLHQAVRSKKTAALVGLDPRFDAASLLRSSGRPRSGRSVTAASLMAAAYEEFCFRLIDVVAPLVPAVKPQSAFFEECGPEGVRTLARVIRRAREAGLIVICDAKRGDIGSTAEAYAAAYLAGEDSDAAPFSADALTVNPYLGTRHAGPLHSRCARVPRGSLRFGAHEQSGSRHLSGSRLRFAAPLSTRGERGRRVGGIDGRDGNLRLRSARSSARPIRASCGNSARRCRMRRCLVPGFGSQGGARPTSPGHSTKRVSARSSTTPGASISPTRENRTAALSARRNGSRRSRRRPKR